jgi:hypothetical protein
MKNLKGGVNYCRSQINYAKGYDDAIKKFNSLDYITRQDYATKHNHRRNSLSGLSDHKKYLIMTVNLPKWEQEKLTNN